MIRIFISDLHLSPGMSTITDGFQRFLDEKCHEIDELYILGDFFDVWLGDDDDNDYYQRIAASLNALTCRVMLMHGNRDFLIGDAFCSTAGATLLPDPTPIDLAGTKTLLMHGDSLCTRDTTYMATRQQLRSATFQAEFLRRPLAERAAFARKLRSESQSHTRETAADIMDVTPNEVVRAMEDAGASVLIHGHTHRPAKHQVSLKNGEGTRYVLGDWHTGTDYLEVRGNEIALRHYTIKL